MSDHHDTVGDLGVKCRAASASDLRRKATLKNLPILLFDEATSALDTESERVVRPRSTS
jgi:ABC-type transport system involved in Fe-S cluster assembly fused permease/ATPase subunit